MNPVDEYFNARNKPEWYLSRVKRLWNLTASGQMPDFYNKRNEYFENIKYVQGLLDPYKYQERIREHNHEKHGNATQNSISWRVINLASKPFRLLLGHLAALSFDVEINPTNPIDRKDVALKLKALMSLNVPKEQKERILATLGVQEMPQTTEDVDIEMMVLGKDDECMDIEDKLRDISEFSSFENALTMCDFDLLTAGMACGETRVDQSGKVFQEPFPFEDLVCGNFKRLDGKDITEVGRVRFLSLSQVLAESCNENGVSPFSDNEIEALQRVANANRGGTYGMYYSTYFPLSYMPKTDGTLPVVDYYVYADKKITYTEKKTKSGKTRFFEKGTENDKTKSIYIPMWYKCTWILNTEIVYNWGPMIEYTKFSNGQYTALPPITVVAPLIKMSIPMPLMSEIKEYCDKANLAFHKMEEDMATARTQGWQLDVDALTNVTLSLGKGKQMSGDDVVRLAMSRNILVYSGSQLKGTNNGRMPMQAWDGGLSKTFGEWANTIKLMQSLIEWTTVPDINMNPDMGKYAASINQMNATKSIQHLMSAKNILFENMTRTAIGLISDTTKFRLSIKNTPTKEEKMEFDTVIIPQALQKGDISYDDLAVLDTLPSLKDKKYYLRLVVKRNKKIAAQNAMQAAQDARQQTLQAHQFKLDEIKTESQGRIAEVQEQSKGAIIKQEQKSNSGLDHAIVIHSAKKDLEETKTQNDIKLKMTESYLQRIKQIEEATNRILENEQNMTNESMLDAIKTVHEMAKQDQLAESNI